MHTALLVLKPWSHLVSPLESTQVLVISCLWDRAQCLHICQFFLSAVDLHYNAPTTSTPQVADFKEWLLGCQDFGCLCP